MLVQVCKNDHVATCFVPSPAYYCCINSIDCIIHLGRGLLCVPLRICDVWRVKCTWYTLILKLELYGQLMLQTFYWNGPDSWWWRLLWIGISGQLMPDTYLLIGIVKQCIGIIYFIVDWKRQLWDRGLYFVFFSSVFDVSSYARRKS